MGVASADEGPCRTARGRIGGNAEMVRRVEPHGGDGRLIEGAPVASTRPARKGSHMSVVFRRYAGVFVTAFAGSGAVALVTVLIGAALSPAQLASPVAKESGASSAEWEAFKETCQRAREIHLACGDVEGAARAEAARAALTELAQLARGDEWGTGVLSYLHLESTIRRAGRRH